MSEGGVLIYRLGSLGDTVIVLPAFHLVREVFWDKPLSLLTNVPVSGKAAPVAEILGDVCAFQEIISYPAGSRSVREITSLLSTLRQKRFSHCVYLAKPKGGVGNLLRDWVLFKLAGIPKVVGIPWRREDRLCLPISGTNLVEWDCERTMRSLRGLGTVDPENKKWWDLKLTAAEFEVARGSLQRFLGRPLVGFSIGTKVPAKDWENENWIPFLRSFRTRYPEFSGFFVGSSDERARCDLLIEESGMSCVNLCGSISARISAAALSMAKLFVGHDSGPMHLAACVGTPVVAIFSARNLAGEWFPRGGMKTNRIIYHRTECAGCGLNVCDVQKKKCVLSITVPEVMEACEKVIDSSFQKQ